MNFYDSQTYQNLNTAYNGELKACAKYQIYGILAREDGYEQIGNIFDETSLNEREHAEIWLNYIHCGEDPGTLDNLIDAASGERYEWTTMYYNFAQTAFDEGYPDIGEKFEQVAAIERNHETRYDKLASNIQNDQVFCKPCGQAWMCLNCGHIHYGECAPEHCPVCGFPQAFFEIYPNNY